MSRLVFFVIILSWAHFAFGDDALSNNFEDDFDDIPVFFQDDSDTISDPLEPLNRVTFFFQMDVLDPIIVKPLSKAYGILPKFLRSGIMGTSNYINNTNVAVNAGLAGDIANLCEAIVSVVANTQFGLFGFDSVDESFGISVKQFSFSDALRSWGIQSNIYFVNPVGPPGTLLDTANIFQSNMLAPVNAMSDTLTGDIAVPINIYGTVSGIALARYDNAAFIDVAKKNSPDFYRATRSAFTAQVQNARRNAKAIHKSQPKANKYSKIISKNKLDYILL